MDVSLPMYDLPELKDAHEVLWHGLRAALSAEGLSNLPDRLAWPDDLPATWLRPDLLFSQTCGYPLITSLAGKVRLVGVPCYDAPGCNGFNYSSALIVRRDSAVRSLLDLQGGTAAFNAYDSQSGYNALRHAVAPYASNGRFFGSVLESGLHETSMQWVADGKADIAAIDCVTYALIDRHRPRETAGLRVLAFTPPMPGLPLITRLSMTPAELAAVRRGFRRAFADPGLADARQALLLTHCAFPDTGIYQQLAAMERDAASRGYPRLA